MRDRDGGLQKLSEGQDRVAWLSVKVTNMHTEPLSQGLETYGAYAFMYISVQALADHQANQAETSMATQNKQYRLYYENMLGQRSQTQKATHYVIQFT